MGTFRSGEEAARAGRRGGVKSGEVRRQKRGIRQHMQALLDSVCDDNMTGGEILVRTLFELAREGNLKALGMALRIAGSDRETMPAVSLPKVNSPEDIPVLARCLVELVAAGELTVTEATGFFGLARAVVKSDDDLSDRQQMAELFPSLT